MNSVGGRGGQHSRQNSLTGRSAFASTEKGKKLGFFNKRRKERFVMPGGYPSEEGRGGGGESLLETRSVMTWVTKGEGKCAVM